MGIFKKFSGNTNLEGIDAAPGDWSTASPIQSANWQNWFAEEKSPKLSSPIIPPKRVRTPPPAPQKRTSKQAHTKQSASTDQDHYLKHLSKEERDIINAQKKKGQRQNSDSRALKPQPVKQNTKLTIPPPSSPKQLQHVTLTPPTIQKPDLGRLSNRPTKKELASEVDRFKAHFSPEERNAVEERKESHLNQPAHSTHQANNGLSAIDSYKAYLSPEELRILEEQQKAIAQKERNPQPAKAQKPLSEIDSFRQYLTPEELEILKAQERATQPVLPIVKEKTGLDSIESFKDHLTAEELEILKAQLQ